MTSILFLVGFQTLLTGLIAELVMRVYHESQHKPIYYIRRVVGAEAGEDDGAAGER